MMTSSTYYQLAVLIVALVVASVADAQQEGEPGVCPMNGNLDEAIVIPGVTDGRLCWNMTMNQSTPQGTNITNHLFGYTWDAPSTPTGGIYLVLSQGCQYASKRVQQWIVSNYPHTFPIVFADPRGSGASRPMFWDATSGCSQTSVPDQSCVDSVKQNNLQSLWNYGQLAQDLNLILTKLGTDPERANFYPVNVGQVRVVAGDLFGQLWIQTYFQYFSPNPAGIFQFYMQNPIPILTGEFSLFKNLVDGPEEAVRKQLNLCMRDPTCGGRFGGRDLNQLLDDLMLSAKQNELVCNSKISTQWATALGGGGASPPPPPPTKPSPIFSFYSELLTMLVSHPLEPVDPRGEWPEELQAWVPAAMYRILRCDDGDATALLKLYGALKTFASTDEQVSLNPPGPYDRQNKCYVNNWLKWGMIFSTLQKDTPPSLDSLLDAANTKTILPNIAFIKEAYAAYTAMAPIMQPNPAPGSEGLYSGPPQYRALVGNAHPTLGAGGHSNHVLGRYYIPANPVGAVTVSNFPSMVNPLYGKPDQNTVNIIPNRQPDFNNSCGVASVLWGSNIPRATEFPACYTEMITGNSYSDFEGATGTTEALRMKFFATTSGDIWNYVSPAAEPPLYPESPLAYITTPLPPGQTYAPTPAPTQVPGATGPLFPPHQRGGSGRGSSDDVDVDDVNTVRVNIVGLVFGILFGIIALIAIVYCMNKCLRKKFADPAKRDFMNEVYGDKGAANEWRN